jgi:hypothetical protein
MGAVVVLHMAARRLPGGRGRRRGLPRAFCHGREKTDADLRQIYDRWVLERACLIELGFSPDPPPPFATFRRDWQTGPWTPIDGIPFRQITGAALDRCGLEMID